MNLYKAAQKSGALSEELNPFKERDAALERAQARVREHLQSPEGQAALKCNREMIDAHKAADAVDTAPNKPVDTVDTTSVVDSAPVDRKAYQREWQRKRRAAQKGQAS